MFASPRAEHTCATAKDAESAAEPPAPGVHAVCRILSRRVARLRAGAGRADSDGRVSTRDSLTPDGTASAGLSRPPAGLVVVPFALAGLRIESAFEANGVRWYLEARLRRDRRSRIRGKRDRRNERAEYKSSHGSTSCTRSSPPVIMRRRLLNMQDSSPRSTGRTDERRPSQRVSATMEAIRGGWGRSFGRPGRLPSDRSPAPCPPARDVVPYPESARYWTS